MIPADLLNTVTTGDARLLSARIPDASVSLIYTDPPYAEEFTPLIVALGGYAPRVLRDGGSLVLLCGHQQVPAVVDAFSALRFRWMGWLESAQKPTLMGVRVVCGGKPIFWFTKGKATLRGGFWWDTKKPEGADKAWHRWGQAPNHVRTDIDLLTAPGDVVMEPFTGGGTVPAVCKQLGRNFVAFEIDPETAILARERIRNTPMPLPLEFAQDRQEAFAL